MKPSTHYRPFQSGETIPLKLIIIQPFKKENKMDLGRSTVLDDANFFRYKKCHLSLKETSTQKVRFLCLKEHALLSNFILLSNQLLQE
jgi:hypothetical protein